MEFQYAIDFKIILRDFWLKTVALNGIVHAASVCIVLHYSVENSQDSSFMPLL